MNLKWSTLYPERIATQENAVWQNASAEKLAATRSNKTSHFEQPTPRTNSYPDLTATANHLKLVGPHKRRIIQAGRKFAWTPVARL